jgi:hypothetical protein
MAVLQQFTILFLMGGTGIVLFTISSIPTVRQQLATLPPEIADRVPPLSVLLLLQGLQYTILLTIAIFIGIGCTRRVGMHSHLIDYWVFRSPKLVSFDDEVKWSLGIAYGWLFWQYSLEAAMISHASFHVVVFVFNILLAKFI